ncbi:MAG: hypothetical protein RRA15_13220 [bacterium]|nr:hypothetical protein [bacterium]MDT8367420.1 hypothetical protein [bacterium]
MGLKTVSVYRGVGDKQFNKDNLGVASCPSSNDHQKFQTPGSRY